jgi:hypothetical protein
LIFFVIEMNVAPLVVMIDSVIIVATPSLKIEWGDLMANSSGQTQVACILCGKMVESGS